MFVFSNENPLVIVNKNILPSVKFDQDIYLFSLNHGVNEINVNSNAEASNIRVSLRNSSMQTLPIITSLLPYGAPSDYLYSVPNFTGVSLPFTMTYEGNETDVRLVVEGYITRSGQDPGANDGTGIITNNFVVSPYSGLIWQVEQ